MTATSLAETIEDPRDIRALMEDNGLPGPWDDESKGHRVGNRWRSFDGTDHVCVDAAKDLWLVVS